MFLGMSRESVFIDSFQSPDLALSICAVSRISRDSVVGAPWINYASI
jgi:hypothetical protein